MVIKQVGALRSSRPQKIVLPGMVALLLISVIVFLPPYLNSFVGDDFVQQWRIRKLISVPEEYYNVFRPGWTDWYYRPLQNLWFLINRLLLGLQPAGYYYFQVLLHLISISLIFNISRRVGVGSLGGFLSAAIFAINAEHQLTVDWISSIGIVASTMLSLSAVTFFLHHLRSGKHSAYLILSFTTWLLALLFHESAILVLPVILWIWLTAIPRQRMNVPSIFFATAFAAVSITYVLIQLSRENANLEPSAVLAISAEPTAIIESVGKFIARAVGGWLSIEHLATDFNSLELSSWLVNGLFLMGSVGLLVLVYIKGNRAMRFGAIWAFLQLAFVLIVLWLPRPELFGGRHLYSAWIGMSLILGGALDKYLTITHYQRKKRLLFNRRLSVVLIALLIFLSLQIVRIRTTQSSTLALTQLTQELERQMKELLPTITDGTRVFAARFVLKPSYFTPVMGVWYADPKLTGGDLGTLSKYQKATKEFFVFDYEDASLYNLMPELQNATETYFLANPNPGKKVVSSGPQDVPVPDDILETDVIAGPDDDRMLAVGLTLQGSDWNSLSYELEIPPRGTLAVSLLAPAETAYRVNIIDETGQKEEMLQESRISTNEGAWIDLEIPLNSYSGSTVIISLESKIISDDSSATIYWGNPRITVN